MQSDDELRDFLLQHARHPRNTGMPAHFDYSGECKNPVCGDQVKVFLSVSEQRVSDVKILASGCAICLASASLMTEMISGQKLSQAKLLEQQVGMTFKTKSSDWPTELGKLLPLQRIRENPMKVPCVLTSWAALGMALAKT